MFGSNWTQKFNEFLKDSRGNVATIFALTLLPVTVLSGGAIDFNQAMNARTRLAQSLDAAALAVGVNTSISNTDALTIANDFMAANYPGRELGTVMNVSVLLDDATDTVTVRGEAKVQTTILGLIGMDDITVHWESQVTRSRQNLELVMVLDNTGSMSGSKIRNLRNAAHLLTDTLFSSASDPSKLNIALVPFSSTVNVGTQYERAWWMDPQSQNPLSSEWLTPAANRWDLHDTIRNSSWTGCVEARAIPMDIDDTPPNPSNPETLFMPYFAPDEPDRGGRYYNNYMNDQVRRGSVFDRLINSGKYWNQSARRGGPNSGCTARPLTPLTNNQRTIDNAINDMIASGTTNIPLGIGWGVRVLSPAEPFTQGVAFDDREVIKAMVILTDGENYISTAPDHFAFSQYTGYGFLRSGRLGIASSSRNQAREALNGRTTAACEYAKSLGIRVYTITFQVNSSSTQNMMEACATSPSLYFNSPSNQALQAAFDAIAGDLSNLRLSR